MTGEQTVEQNPWLLIDKIRELIAEKQLNEAWDLLESHISPLCRQSQTAGASLLQIKYLRLKSEILYKSSEPERAILVAAEAMRLSYDQSFFREFREIKEATSRMAEVFQE